MLAALAGSLLLKLRVRVRVARPAQARVAQIVKWTVGDAEMADELRENVRRHYSPEFADHSEEVAALQRR